MHSSMIKLAEEIFVMLAFDVLLPLMGLIRTKTVLPFKGCIDLKLTVRGLLSSVQVFSNS